MARAPMVGATLRHSGPLVLWASMVVGVEQRGAGQSPLVAVIVLATAVDVAWHWWTVVEMPSLVWYMVRTLDAKN